MGTPLSNAFVIQRKKFCLRNRKSGVRIPPGALMKKVIILKNNETMQSYSPTINIYYATTVVDQNGIIVKDRHGRLGLKFGPDPKQCG
jgi:hypothetical protein